MPYVANNSLLFKGQMNELKSKPFGETTAYDTCMHTKCSAHEMFCEDMTDDARGLLAMPLKCI